MNSTAPLSAEELAETLRAASGDGRPVTPWGAGTHQHLGAPTPPDALTIQLCGLGRVLEYAPADLTATVEAGVTLGALQETLARQGQWLPWDPPGGAGATVGGLLAAGRSGALRLGYGAPRDWVLGMRVALGDGRLVKSGGRVVKNVAGYDAHKLHIGALGTLGVIAEVTFKLSPIPERLGTLLVPCGSSEQAVALAERLRERPLSPVSLAVLGGTGVDAGRRSGAVAAIVPSIDGHSSVLVARFAGVAAAVERQLREARERAVEAGLAPVELAEGRTEQLWRDLAEFPTPGAGELVLRAGATPSAIGPLVELLERHGPAGASSLLYPGVGLAYARWPVTEGAPPREAVARLRGGLAQIGGYAVVEAAPEESGLDLWGPPPESFALMRRLKQQWDPAGILNRGRYLGGL
jgi:glycolate oxidase FAD binding subunit